MILLETEQHRKPLHSKST